MNPAHNEAEIFMEALELDDPGERAAFVQRACDGDSTLLKRVEGLLDRQSRLGRFLESPAVATDPCAQGPIWGPEGPGTMIGGRYKLLEQIGEGGFGVVYLAEQQEPVRREVALKIIKPGMDTRQVIARFEAERQALALMDHPNIAKVLDGGVIGATSVIRNQKSEIPAGRPYFVMERVRGQPITQFCEDHQLPIRERLELFIAVCHAIQHAHQKGVIHRDIKPSNVLVTLDHGAPHPMVIDFGVAKALEQPLTERTLHTRFGQMIGTPAYMSPEQADLSRQDVDTRSDVYGLGILLYELLTGTTPFPEERLRTAGLAGILRILHEEEPLRPSTTVSRMNGRLRALALNRRSEPAALIQLIQGDLDWIVLKAIEKDRRRRYDGPADLAADVRRHLADEPVLARPPSTVYQLRKFARRHQVLVTATAVIAVMLVLTAAFSVWQALRATRAQAVAEEQRQEAAQQAAIAAAMNEFLTEDLLRQADVWKAEAHASPNRDIRLLEIVDRASEGVDAKFGSQPLVAAKIHLTVGSVYAGLGEIEKAEHHLRTAKRLFDDQVGPDDPRTLEASHALAVLLRVNRAAYEEAETMIRQVLHVRQRTLGPDHRDTLSAMLELADIRSARNDYVTAGTMFAEATRLATLALGADDPLALKGREAEIETIRGRGEWHTAKRLQQELWETRKRVQGESHPDTLNSLWYLAWLTQRSETDIPRVEQLVEEGLKLSRRVLGDHGATHELELTRSSLLKYKGLIKASRELREQRLTIAERVYGPSHPATIGSRHYVAYLQASVGIQPLEALRILEDCLDVHRRIAPDSRGAQINRNWLASVYWHLGQTDDCLAIWQENLAIRQRLYGVKSPSALQAIQSLGDLNARLGNWVAASAFLTEFAQSESADVRSFAKAPLACALSNPATLPQDWPPVNWEQAVASGDASDANQLLASLLLLSITEGSAHQEADGGPSGRGEYTAHFGTLIQAVAQHLNGGVPLVERRILTGLVGIANKQWDDAIELLEPVAQGAPDPEARILAGYLVSLALVHQGFDMEAQHAFDDAEITLRRLAAAGQLGSRWDRLALGLVIRNHAAEFLPYLGPPEAIDSSYLAHARQRWEPVHEELQRTFLLARGWQWTEATSALRQVMARDDFSWEAAELSVYRWPIKVVLILASAGEPLARVISHLNPVDSQMPSRDAVGISLFPIRTMGDARESFLLDALRFDAEFLEVSIPGAPGWRRLLNGLMLLQHGRPSDALAELCEAEASYNLHCAGAASAYRAQASFHLHDRAQGHSALQRADAILLQLRENEGEDLGEVWVERSLLELAVDEARQMAESIPPAS